MAAEERLHTYVQHNAAAFPDRCAVSYRGRRLGYRELAARIVRYGELLRGTGVRPGDRVVVQAGLTPNAVAAVLAVLQAGCCLVTAHPTFGTGKLVHQIRETDAAVLLSDAARWGDKHLADLLRRTDLLSVVFLDDGPREGRVVRRTRPLDRPRRGAGIPLGEDPAAVFFTSGSSAAPKGVTVSHTAMTAAFRAVTARLDIGADDVILSATPIGSDFGFYNAVMPPALGGRIVLLDTVPTEPEALLDLIAAEGVTGVHAFPGLLALVARAVDAEGRAPRSLPTLRYWSSTGQRLPVEHIRLIRSAYPDVALHSMYGLTECKRVAMLDPRELDRRPGSVGRPLPEVPAFLVDDDGRLITEPDTVGELAVGGDLVMEGYWNAPEATARSLRRGLHGCERVYFTGDLFTRDAEGFLYWKSRRDEVFSRSMFKVDPHEIEDLLRRHPDVADATVVPLPDEEAGHVPVAVVVPRGRRSPSEAELILHCRRSLDWHMVPTRVVLRPAPALPRTESGKTDRRALRELLLHDEARPMNGTS